MLHHQPKPGSEQDHQDRDRNQRHRMFCFGRALDESKEMDRDDLRRVNSCPSMPGRPLPKTTHRDATSITLSTTFFGFARMIWLDGSSCLASDPQSPRSPWRREK